jgi:hypothetical protein
MRCFPVHGRHTLPETNTNLCPFIAYYMLLHQQPGVVAICIACGMHGGMHTCISAGVDAVCIFVCQTIVRTCVTVCGQHVQLDVHVGSSVPLHFALLVVCNWCVVQVHAADTFAGLP